MTLSRVRSNFEESEPEQRIWVSRDSRISSKASVTVIVAVMIVSSSIVCHPREAGVVMVRGPVLQFVGGSGKPGTNLLAIQP
jgi:hypothetical protein